MGKQKRKVEHSVRSELRHLRLVHWRH